MSWWSPVLPWNPTPPALPLGSKEVPLVTTNGMRAGSIQFLTNSLKYSYHAKVPNSGPGSGYYLNILYNPVVQRPALSHAISSYYLF